MSLNYSETLPGGVIRASSTQYEAEAAPDHFEPSVRVYSGVVRSTTGGQIEELGYHSTTQAPPQNTGMSVMATLDKSGGGQGPTVDIGGMRTSLDTAVQL